MKKRTSTLSDVYHKEELDRIEFRGHKNILGTHRNSIELTKEPDVTKKGNCIIGVMASKACADLHPSLRNWISSGKWLEFEVRIGDHSFTFRGRGSPELNLLDDKEIVLRRSDFASPRTAAINCSHSAREIPRDLIKALQNPDAKATLGIRTFPMGKDIDFFWSLP
jgi:hypothetical protein